MENVSVLLVVVKAACASDAEYVATMVDSEGGTC